MDEILKSHLRQELRSLLGPRRFLVHDSRSDRLGVALPETVAEVQQMVRLTGDAKIPLIPRGATSNPFAGPEPSEGLVVSFDRLSQIRGANTRTRLATVQPGVLWHTLIDHLATRSLMLRVYPSSEGYSTVGGFIAQGGVGIGSYQFGDIGQNVAAVRLVDAHGELRRLKGQDLGLVVGAQGRTGVIVDVTLRVQDLTSMAPCVALFDSLENAGESLANVAKQTLPIWSVNLMDPAGAALQTRNWPDLPVPEGKYAVLFSFRTHDAGLVVPTLQAAARSAGAQLLNIVGDTGEWLVQFASLQALGTTPVPMQFQMPLGRAAEFVSRMPQDLRDQLAIEAVVADGGKTIAVRLFFIERQATPDMNVRVARELLVLAKQVDGVTYTTGAVYLDEAEAVFGAERLQDIAAFRRTADPDDRLNPGRAFR